MLTLGFAKSADAIIYMEADNSRYLPVETQEVEKVISEKIIIEEPVNKVTKTVQPKVEIVEESIVEEVVVETEEVTKTNDELLFDLFKELNVGDDFINLLIKLLNESKIEVSA